MASSDRHRQLIWDALLLIVLPALIRLILIGSFELCEVEAYYWQWARHLAFSYHDQGPGLAVAIKAGTALFGHNEFGVRFFAVFLFAVSSLFTYLMVRRLFDRRAAFISLILFNVAPLFSAGAILMMHESIQGFFWAVGMYCFVRAVDLPRSQNSPPAPDAASAWGWWLATGLCVGLGFDGKYTMILFLPAALFFLAIGSRDRDWLKKPQPYVGALLSLAAVTPVLYWNQVHGWPSVLQVLELGNRPGQWPINPLHFFELIGAQFGIVSPILYALMMWRLWHAYRDGIRSNDRTSRLLLAFAVFYFGPFYLYSFRSYIYANWPGLGYYAGLILLSAWAARQGPADPGSKSYRWFKAGTVLAAAMTIILYLQLAFMFIPVPAKLDTSNRFYGWQQLAEEVDRIKDEMQKTTQKPLHFYAKSYQVASELAFYAQGRPQTYEIKKEARANQYDYWPDIPAGDNALLVLYENEHLPEVSRQSFDSIEQVDTVTIEKHGKTAKVFKIFLCKNYRP